LYQRGDGGPKGKEDRSHLLRMEGVRGLNLMGGKPQRGRWAKQIPQRLKDGKLEENFQQHVKKQPLNQTKSSFSERDEGSVKRLRSKQGKEGDKGSSHRDVTKGESKSFDDWKSDLISFQVESVLKRQEWGAR